MIGNRLISQINTASPLPGFLVVVLVDSANTTLMGAFNLAHSYLSGTNRLAASLLPWRYGIWIVLCGLVEHRLLLHSNTTFIEMLFRIVRGRIVSPACPSDSRGKLLWWLFGPRPVPPLEERVLVTPTSTDIRALNTEVCDSKASYLLAADSAPYGHLQFQPLTGRQKLIALVLLVLKPYLQSFLARWYKKRTEELQRSEDSRREHRKLRTRLEKIERSLLSLYPIANATASSLNLLFKILYLLEMTPYTSPLNRIFGIALRRATPADPLPKPVIQAEWGMAIVHILFFFFYTFRFLDFAEPEGPSTQFGGGDDLSVPDPPVWGVDVTVPAGTPEPRPSVCPVCERKVNNMAVCTSSGIVGCYPCLLQHIREHGTCPVTRRTASVESVRRIYES